MTDPQNLRSAFESLGQAAYNMNYADFREALGLWDDDYGIDKYQQFKAIGKAMCAFSDTTLASLVDAYIAPKANP
jgi:hypothetical protein